MKAGLLAFLMLAFGCVVWMTVYTIVRQSRRRSAAFIVLCGATGMYLLGYILELLSSDLGGALIANKVQNVGIPALGPMLLLFTLGLSDTTKLRNWMFVAAGGYSFFMFWMVLFNEYHYLYYTETVWSTAMGISFLTLKFGPFYYVQQAVSMLCGLGAYAIVVLSYKKWELSVRKKVLFVTLSSVTVFLANLLYATGIIPRIVDPTPFALTFVLLLCMFYIIRYRILDITSIATETAIETMDDAMIVLDGNWNYRYSNKSADLLFPGLEELGLGKQISEVEGWPLPLSAFTGTGKFNFELADQDEIHYFRANVSAVGKKGNSVGWSIVIRDITETVALLDKMKLLATTDSLTGIFNRRYFLELVQRELEIAKRKQTKSAMIIFDLDHFKQVNDTYGHQAGDRLLASVANAVRGQLRTYDIFARYGGEEFALYIVDISEQDAQRFTQRLCEAVSKVRVFFRGQDIGVTASFGIVPVCWSDHMEDIISAADKAMYKAKEKGRNCIEIGTVSPTSMMTDQMAE